MTRRPDLDRTLESWMQEGPDVLPDHALDEALDRVERTRQRPMALVHQRMLGTAADSPLVPLWATVAGVAAAVLALAVMFAGVGRPSIGEEEEPTPTPPPSAPTRAALRPEAIIPVPGAWIALAEGDRVLVAADEQLVSIDVATNETTAIPVPIPKGSWAGLAAADGDVWVGNFDDGVLYRIDPDSGETLAEVEVGPEAVSITAVPGSIWARTRGGVTWEAQRIDTETNELVVTADGGNSIAYGHGSLWFGQRGANRILRADPVTGETTAVISVPRDDACEAAPTADAVWAFCFQDRPSGTVTRIDPATNEVVATIRLGGVAGGVFEVNGQTWVSTASPDGGAFERIDLETNTVERVLLVGPGFAPDNAAIAGGSVWTSNDNQDEVYRFPLDAFRSP
ncbi:MAG: hypothetical protein LC798_20625 [Chloroflexi bacterium]|nr:hypothetical protein [Chloroflexota bacterium]